MNGDDERLGQLVKQLRRRAAMTQVVLARAAGLPVNDVKAIEGGHAGDVQLDRLRRTMEALDGRLRLVPWWNGASADRLLDERHARISERGAGYLRGYRWLPHIELTFSEFGERGSIDIFATRESELAVSVCEVKTAFGSLEETNRVLDMKERLAPTITQNASAGDPGTWPESSSSHATAPSGASSKSTP